MKESTGGALLLGLAASILLIFIIFAAFFISYGKTFKIKNRVINELEQQEGLSKVSIDEIIEKSKYNSTKEPYICYNLIERNGTIIGLTYKVTLYMTFDRTIVGNLLSFDIPISGETRTIDSGNIFDIISKNNIDYDSPIEGINKCN